MKLTKGNVIKSLTKTQFTTGNCQFEFESKIKRFSVGTRYIFLVLWIRTWKDPKHKVDGFPQGFEKHESNSFELRTIFSCDGTSQIERSVERSNWKTREEKTTRDDNLKYCDADIVELWQIQGVMNKMERTKWPIFLFLLIEQSRKMRFFWKFLKA